MKTFAVILCTFLIAPVLIDAQPNLSKVHQLQSKGQYARAVKELEQLTLQNPENQQVELELARSYNHNGQMVNSLKLYHKISYSDPSNPTAILEYAELLRSQAAFVQAKEQFVRYAEFNPVVGANFASACDFAIKQLGNPKHCDLENLKQSESVAIVYKDDVITDTKSLNNLTTKEAIPANPSAPILSKKALNSKKSLDEIVGTSNLENANISFNEDGNIVAFSHLSSYKLLNNRENASSIGEIFFAKVEDNGTWSGVEAFPYNNSSYSVCNPSLANNGNTMYFASNQKGGFGGFDLYVSYNINNHWTNPTNLGAVINTPGNEISPFYKGGDLFFSSDWHKGFGGYDVMRTSQNGLSWTDIENVGPCVNSAKDDYNFVLDSQNDGYFNSNRSNANTSNNIFKTSKLLLKSNNPSLKAISNDDVSIKSPLQIISNDEVTNLSNSSIVSSVDDPAIGFLTKEQQSTKLYFVQIAAITNYTAAAESRLKNYTKYGSVYKTIEANVTKIRIGGYNNLNEALGLMKVLRKNGFKDIFVVADIPTEGRCILVHKANTDFAASTGNDDIEGKLKIRVAEFKAPDWFDSSKINDLGQIEHWTKNGWTIIVLGSYKTPNEAISVLDKVRERGFKEAYIVIEENGRLYRQN